MADLIYLVLIGTTFACKVSYFLALTSIWECVITIVNVLSFPEMVQNEILGRYLICEYKMKF